MINKQFCRFLMVGVVNTLFGYGLYSFFVYMNLHYTIAVLLSTVIGVLFNFKTIGRFVFESNDDSLVFKFIIIYVIIYILNVSGLYIFEYFDYKNMYINGLMLLIPLSMLSFILNKKIVFKENYEKN